jgi:hypothetical protein
MIRVSRYRPTAVVHVIRIYFLIFREGIHVAKAGEAVSKGEISA